MEEPQVFWLIWDFARSVSYFCWLGFGFFFFLVFCFCFFLLHLEAPRRAGALQAAPVRRAQGSAQHERRCPSCPQPSGEKRLGA